MNDSGFVGGFLLLLSGGYSFISPSASRDWSAGRQRSQETDLGNAMKGDAIKHS